MRYAGINWNDMTAGDGLCVTFYTQGCPHRCKGCHNPDTWNFTGGKEFPSTLLDEIIQKLNAQGIQRAFCIMGGEPLCDENLFLTRLLVLTVNSKSPKTPIYVWTGYTIDELSTTNPHLRDIFDNIDYLIDGPYVEELRDITLHMRGSSNQRIIDMKEKKENYNESFYGT